MADHGDFEAEVTLIVGKQKHRITPSTADIKVDVHSLHSADADMMPELDGATNDTTLDFLHETEGLERLLGFREDS